MSKASISTYVNEAQPLHIAMAPYEDGWEAKTRRCKAVVVQAPCSLGSRCSFAHCAKDLRPSPWCNEVVEHWQGQVSVGVVEHAMFWDLPPVGTTDVVVNRSTCLGNPFGACMERCECDAEGWRVQEHEQLVAAFDEYLQVVLAEGSSSLEEEVRRIAAARQLQASEAWQLAPAERHEVRGALRALANLVAQGRRLRLLCHCRPHVRCHAVSLKGYLDRFASPLEPEPPELDPELVDVLGCVWPGTTQQAPREWKISCMMFHNVACFFHFLLLATLRGLKDGSKWAHLAFGGEV